MISFIFIVLITLANAQWGCFVPYTINRDIPDLNKLKTAISIFNKQTKLTLIEQTNEVDYIEFMGGNGCSSYIGKRGRKQTIVLNKNCQLFTNIHEIYHAIGFQHEQSRPDRNDYLTVNYNNIKDEYKDQYDQYFPSQVYNFSDMYSYDFESVMHYELLGFSNGNGYTMSPLVEQNVTIGQRYKLSTIDLLRINSIYSYCQKEIQLPECRESDVQFFSGNVNNLLDSYYKIQSLFGSGISFIDNLFVGYTKEYNTDEPLFATEPVIKRDIIGNWVITYDLDTLAYSNSKDLFTTGGWTIKNKLTGNYDAVPSARMFKRENCKNIIPEYKYISYTFWIITAIILLILILIITCCCICRRRRRRQVIPI